MASEVKFLGTTDDVTTCDCCGRENLKSTVALSVDGGEAKRDAEHRAFMARWSAFLTATATSGTCVATRIEALGGMKRARELYNASEYSK